MSALTGKTFHATLLAARHKNSIELEKSRMTGLIETIAARAVTLAANPIAKSVKGTLSRKGFGRTDILSALKFAEHSQGEAPPTYGILSKLPNGVTDKHVREALESPEGQNAIRYVISVRLLHQQELSKDQSRKVQTMLAAIFSGLATSSNQRSLTSYIKSLVDVLDAYSERFSIYLLRKINEVPDVVDWAYKNISSAHLRSIDKYLELLASNGTSDTEGVNEWIESYKKAFVYRHSYIEVPDLTRRKKLHYSLLYVGTRFAPTSQSSYFNLADKTTTAFEDVQPGSFHRLFSDGEVIANLTRSVVLGDPGAGKSTTSSILALRAWDSHQTVPFFINMKSVEFYNDGFNVIDVIESTLQSVYQTPPPKGAIEKLLYEARVFVVFDGLDELLDGADRRNAARVIDAFANRFPYAKVLVTCRTVGYYVARLDKSIFDEYTLAQFSEAQVEEYARKWFASEESGEFKSYVAHFLRASKTIGDLRRNPLMLAFMCVLYRGYQYIPHKKPEIFRKCVDLVLHEWDRARGIANPDVDMDYVELGLTYIAHKATRDKSFFGGFNESELYDLLIPRLIEESIPDRRTARRIVTELISTCRGRAWIFTDVGTDDQGCEIFSFTHSSFREYFAARYIERTCNVPEDTAKKVLEEVSHGSGEVLGQVCIATAERHAVGGATRVFKYALDQVSRHASDNRNVSVIEFLIRASESVSIRLDCIGMLTQKALDIYVEERSGMLLDLVSSANRNSVSFKEEMAALLARSLTIYTRAECVERQRHARTAWLAAHFGYMVTKIPDETVSADNIRYIREQLFKDSRREICNPSGVFEKAMAIYLENTGIFDSEPAPFTFIFSSIPRALDLGPASIVDWIVDCFISPIRQYLFISPALALLREIGRSIDDVSPAQKLPDFPSFSRSVDLSLIANRLYGHGWQAVRGWCGIAACWTEMHEIAGNIDREKAISQLGLRELFVKLVEFDSGSWARKWVCSEFDFWRREDISVS